MTISIRALASVLLASIAHTADASDADALAGYWRTDDGSAVIEIGPCAQKWCGKIISFDASIGTTDSNNPEHALRTRPVCGLLILVVTGADRSGRDRWELYDPSSGERYKNVRVSQARSTLRFEIPVGPFRFPVEWTSVDMPTDKCAVDG
jgi:uncharacterized protein (DUF2147 family)